MANEITNWAEAKMKRTQTEHIITTACIIATAGISFSVLVWAVLDIWVI